MRCAMSNNAPPPAAPVTWDSRTPLPTVLRPVAPAAAGCRWPAPKPPHRRRRLAKLDRREVSDAGSVDQLQHHGMDAGHRAGIDRRALLLLGRAGALHGQHAQPLAAVEPDLDTGAGLARGDAGGEGLDAAPDRTEVDLLVAGGSQPGQRLHSLVVGCARTVEGVSVSGLDLV